MHPEIVSIALFWFVAAYTPGPNNVVASYSGFNFGIMKTIPHILGVTLGFTSLVLFLTSKDDSYFCQSYEYYIHCSGID